MKWLVFVMTLLAFCVFSKGVLAVDRVREHVKEPRTMVLSEADVAPIKTALGYTTMLNFDGRPSSVILGDQDAFKIEYAGNGLAIKPVVAHAKTNLFVFTDYDRFSFRLLAGPAAEAAYAVRIKGKRTQSYAAELSEQVTASAPLIEKRVSRRKLCNGFQLEVESIAWPRSESTYLVRFHVTAVRAVVPVDGLAFEPGDFDISQEGRSLAVENLYLERLILAKQAKSVRGTLVLRQSELKQGPSLVLSFAPDFLKQQSRCLSVSFSRRTASLTQKKG